MYKDGFELIEGNYYWAKWNIHIDEPPFIARWDEVHIGWGAFSICASDCWVTDDEITLLKEVKYGN